MAFWEEGFEGQSPGPLSPTDWTYIPGQFANVVDTDHYPAIAGGSQALDLSGHVRRTDETTFYDEFTLYFAVKMPSGNALNPDSILEFAIINPNYLEADTHYISLLNLFIAADNTLSLQGHGVFLGNSAPRVLSFNEWNFLQVSVSLTDVAGKIAFTCDIFIDGERVIHCISQVSDVTTSTTYTGLPELNRFNFGNFAGAHSFFDSITLDAYTTDVTYPHPHASDTHISQAVLEVGRKPTTAKSLVSQAVVEVGRKPTTARTRISQMVIELPTIRKVRKWRIYEA